MTKIAILASGTGSTAQSLIDASSDEDLGGGEVSIVISDRKEAHVLERGRAAAIEALFLDPKLAADRDGYCQNIADILKDRNIDFICLAGFMKILAPAFVKTFTGRILNTHSSLLPSFPGAHPVRDALEWGAKITGATIHFVDEDVDHGPIVLQEAIEILESEDEAALHARIKEIECRIYPRAVRLVLSGKTRVEGRKVRIA